MLEVIVDFETACAADLKLVGAAKYSEHPTFEVLCLCWDADNTVGEWRPGEGMGELLDLINGHPATFVSHGSFEQYVWMNYMHPIAGFPPLPPERWRDVQAVAAHRSLPLKHEKLAQVLGVDAQKDMEGSRLTIGLSRPDKKTGMLDRRPETLARVLQYCHTDVAGEKQNYRRLGWLPPAEEQIWRLTETINQRGIAIDIPYVRAMKQIVTDAAVPLLAEFRDLTSGINPGQRDAVLGWCKGQGVELENLQKKYLTELLGEDDEGTEATSGLTSFAAEDDAGEMVQGRSTVALPPDVRRVLEIRGVLGAAAIKKIDRMLACVCADGRVRGIQQYHAAGTGRFGGRLLQPHNFPWDKEGTLAAFDTGTVVDTIMSGDYATVERVLGGNAINAVGLSLRYALTPGEGMVFEEGDYSSIEARIVLALAGQHDKTALIAAGQDPYLDMADAMYRPGDRTTGKAAVLGCGFQCGPGNFNNKFLGGKDLQLAEQCVAAYRETWASHVPELWATMKEACHALIFKGIASKPYGCHFHIVDEWMVIDLPSGWQRLWYYKPHVAYRDEQWGYCPAYWTMKSGQWKRVYLYGGLLTENVVQALARGLLCSAMGRLEVRNGRPIVLTVHDEILCEVPEGRADLVGFRRIMADPTRWAVDMGVPIAVDVPDEPWRRYQK